MHGDDDATGAPKGGSCPAWRRPDHQRAKDASTLKNVGGRVDGGGRGGGDGIRGGGEGQPNLAAITQSAVGASVTSAMEGVEDIMKAYIEDRTTAADSVKGILSVTRVHLRHI